MSTFAFSRYALSIIAAAASLAGCGGSQPPISAPGAMPQRQTSVLPDSSSSAYRVLRRFDHRIDGFDPRSQLIEVHGTLYGTTSVGGEYRNGTVYRISAGGVFKTLYSFRGGSGDGEVPLGGLLDVNGTFYGTTLFGGLHKEECNLSSRGHSGCGTVFTITPSGEERVIHEFQGGADGNNPASGLIEVKGLLYGTTSSGGYADRAGTVYTITTSGVENVLYTFAGGLDAASPMTNLVYADGKLYGAASYGGSNYFYGAVYSVTTTGIEKVLYSFKGGADGGGPSSALIDVDGALYGTTAFGGVSGCFYNNDTCGTVYRISTEGKERVVHAFLPSGDGSYPHGGLSEIQGMLYGTTTTGGSYGCHPLYQLRYGCGTVYSVSTSGTEQVLHSFSGGADGAFPVARLLAAHGTLYGTTQKHPGTVFALTP